MQTKHLVFLVPIWRFQYYRHILQNQKPKQMATPFSNHSLDLYLSKSLGPLNQVIIQRELESIYLSPTN